MNNHFLFKSCDPSFKAVSPDKSRTVTTMVALPCCSPKAWVSSSNGKSTFFTASPWVPKSPRRFKVFRQHLQTHFLLDHSHLHVP